LRITIGPDREENVGSIVVGNLDCFAPGNYCDSWGPPVVVSFPCLKKVDLAHEMPGSLIYLNHTELEKRAVQKVYPKFPQNAPQGYRIWVAVMISKNGKVLCAGLDGDLKAGISAKAILAAAKGWRFKPMTNEFDYPVGALGRLEFIVAPESMK
jgi:hypothetical protein